MATWLSLVMLSGMDGGVVLFCLFEGFGLARCALYAR